MRLFVMLTEELESRPGDDERVDSLARHLRAVGRDAGAGEAAWLVQDAPLPGPRRPRPLTRQALARAAVELAAQAGTPPWLFEAGRAASTDAAEAIALLLPWPCGPSTPTSRPTLAQWTASWHAAASETAPGTAGNVAATIAATIVATIAALDDPMTRRWAVRAVCGLVKPIVTAWQWQRAWAFAFDDEAYAVAWREHRHRRADAVDVPRPQVFAVLPDAPVERHADLLAAWLRADAWVEPRWNGVRVQVVHRDGALAIWQRGGGLLNASLPATLVSEPEWPDPCTIEAVLVEGTSAGTGSLHLVLTDWHHWTGDDASRHDARERRGRLLQRWPPHETDSPPPAVFTTPTLAMPSPLESPRALQDLADAGRARGWRGLVLRHADHRAAVPELGSAHGAWVIRSNAHRIRAVLQYVPSEALGVNTAAALAFVDCGFALWNRAPLSDDEVRAAMTAAMAGKFLDPPPQSPHSPPPPHPLPALRLLPLVRLPLPLPDDELQRIHPWLRAHVGQRFGAVHAVAPALVFEIGFTGVNVSNRRKSGVVLDGAQVLAWWPDAAPGSAQRLDELGS